jgi:hypothetical protein
MHHALTHSWRSLTAALASIALMLGLATAIAPSANAETMTKKDYLQALVAHEKLSYDVFTRLALLHPRGPFRLMARAEQRDLERMRKLLSVNEWPDLTRGDRRGQFRHFPLAEQTYFDMIANGQNSIGDGARVGVTLQQMSLGIIFETFDYRLSRRERTQLMYSRVYSTNRMVTLWGTIARQSR